MDADYTLALVLVQLASTAYVTLLQVDLGWI